jgi:hypothetical protein
MSSVHVPPTLDDTDLIEDTELIPDVETTPDGLLDSVVAVLSAQLTYRKALLESPNRATTAMESEVRMLFGTKKLGRPVLFADIPLGNRKFILRNLDGYKEKFSPDGVFTKSKARVFADGSKQLAEFTAESSSPVARIESIYALAGIAAFRDWPVMRFDVVCGYPNARRPPEVQYRYLQLNSEVTSVVVRLFPEHALLLIREAV